MSQKGAKLLRPEQVVRLVRQAEEELARGKALQEFCREEQISPATHYRWQRKNGGLQVEEAKRLKALEVENAKLKRLLAESLLANDALQEFLSHLPWSLRDGAREKRLTAEGCHTMIKHMESKGFSQRAASRWSGRSRSRCSI